MRVSMKNFALSINSILNVLKEQVKDPTKVLHFLKGLLQEWTGEHTYIAHLFTTPK